MDWPGGTVLVIPMRLGAWRGVECRSVRCAVSVGRAPLRVAAKLFWERTRIDRHPWRRSSLPCGVSLKNPARRLPFDKLRTGCYEPGVNGAICDLQLFVP